MAINRFMMAALKALSYVDYDLKENYKLDRVLDSVLHPPSIKRYRNWERKLCVRGRELPVRIYDPKTVSSDEIIIFFHGGGWVSGSLEGYSKTCANLAEHTGRRVYALGYRKAPEFPFPCALRDCYLLTKELSVNGEGSRVILMGDSAGGNLAAAVSLLAASRGEFKVERQILIYPLTYNDHTENSPFPSVTENGTGYLLTAKRVSDYMALYVSQEKYLRSPYLAPLLSNKLHGQPDTLIITAEYDPLRDEGEAYGKKLREFGNNVSIVRMRNALHGFFVLPPRYTHVKKSYAVINRFLEGERNINLYI